MVFYNIDDEIEKLKKLKELTDNINTIEIEKMFISKEQLAKIFGCSVRTAGEFMNNPDFPLIKIGNKPMVNVFALNEYTQQRLVFAEQKKSNF